MSQVTVLCSLIKSINSKIDKWKLLGILYLYTNSIYSFYYYDHLGVDFFSLASATDIVYNLLFAFIRLSDDLLMFFMILTIIVIGIDIDLYIKKKRLIKSKVLTVCVEMCFYVFIIMLFFLVIYVKVNPPVGYFDFLWNSQAQRMIINDSISGVNRIKFFIGLLFFITISFYLFLIDKSKLFNTVLLLTLFIMYNYGLYVLAVTSLSIPKKEVEIECNHDRKYIGNMYGGLSGFQIIKVKNNTFIISKSDIKVIKNRN